MHGERTATRESHGSYADMMMAALMAAQDAQRTVLREALAPGGDPHLVEKIMLGMEQYL